MKIEQNKSLKSLNTFGVEAAAEFFVEVHSVEEFRGLTGDKRFMNAKKLILGGGSNILFKSDFDGWVVKAMIPGVEVVSENETEVVVKAGAGENWNDFVMECIQRNYAGLENLSLIPGLTGAAPIQNIGAYGVEMKDTFHELEAVEIRSGTPVKFDARDCVFGYRDSIFKHQWQGQFLVTSVSFKLAKISSPKVQYHFQIEYGDIRSALDKMKAKDLSLKRVSDAICQLRRAKLPDPKELGNAGSFFKNPFISQAQFKALVSQYPKMPHYLQEKGAVKVPAGWLMEQCGWKGKTMGCAGSHKMQALVLVNYGGAAGQEILDFSEAILKAVKEKFGIELSPEVTIV